MGNKWGFHSGTGHMKDCKISGDLYVQDDIVFSDVSAGVLGVTGGIDMQETTSAIGIDMGGTFTTAINIDGTCTTAIAAVSPINVTLTAPTAAKNGIYSLVTASANWSGSLAAGRFNIVSTATGAIGNTRCIMALLDMRAQPSSSGHSAAGYFEGKTTGASTNLTSVLSVIKSGNAGGRTTPLLLLGDNATTKTQHVIDFGGVVGGGALGISDNNDTKDEAFLTGGGNNTNFVAGLVCLVNNVEYVLPVMVKTSWDGSA